MRPITEAEALEAAAGGRLEFVAPGGRHAWYEVDGEQVDPRPVARLFGDGRFRLQLADAGEHRYRVTPREDLEDRHV